MSMATSEGDMHDVGLGKSDKNPAFPIQRKNKMP